MKKLLLAVFSAAYVMTLAGCHTVHGAGQDVQSAGKGIQKVADKND